MLMGSSSTPNLSFIGIVDFSQEARWIYMTESVTDLLGYEPRDLVGRPSLELVHPDEFPRVKQLHYDTIRQDKAAVLVYLRMKHKDPLKGYVLCGVSRTVVHDVLVGSVSFANPNKALQNASTAQEITVIAPEARNFQFRRWHDPSPMPPSPIPERMRVLPAAFLELVDGLGGGGGIGGMGGPPTMNGGLGGASIEYVDIEPRSTHNTNGHGHAPYSHASTRPAPSPSRSPSPPPQHQRRVSASPYAERAYRSPAPAYGRDYHYEREYEYEYTRNGGEGGGRGVGAHIASQESYARRRSPSYATPDPYDRDRDHDHDRDRDRDYPPSPASPAFTPESPAAYTPESPYSTPLMDSRRRLSGSSSSSSGSGSRSGSGSSRSFARSGGSHSHIRNGVNGANASNGRSGVDDDGDTGSDRRLGHSTSWTRRRVGSATPTPATPGRVGGEDLGAGIGRDRNGDRDNDVDMDSSRDRDRERERERDVEEERRRERERELTRDLEEEEERRYRERERYLSPEVHGDRDLRGLGRERDFAANRYYSPAPSSTSTANGVNGPGYANGHGHGHGHGHGVNGTTPPGRHPAEAHARHSLTPSPPRSAYRAPVHAPASPSYASVTRISAAPHRHLLPSPRIVHQPLSPMAPPPPLLPPVVRPREPSPVITFAHLPAQSSRTAFILDRFTDKSSIMYCSNTLLIFPASAGASSSTSISTSSSSSPTAIAQGQGQGQGRRSGSPPSRAHNHNHTHTQNHDTWARNANANDELAQANAIGRPFFDFVVPRDEQIVRDWIACVKGWGVNEKGQPSDGGFGFGRFGLVREGRESAPRNPDPAPISRGGRKRHGSTSGRGRTTGATRRGIDQSGRRRPGGNGGSSASVPASSTGGNSPPGASTGGVSGDSDAEREREREAQRQRQREAEVTVIEVDAIFSAHSDGLMVILRRAS